jgi:hypothetical protein
MISRFKKQPSQLNEAIDKLLEEMRLYDPTTPEYQAALEGLGKLLEMRREEQRPLFSYDTLISSGATLLGIAFIVGYEQKHVVTSKALMLLNRPRN